ncbi:ankyrin repeat-containing domain protein [Xylaria palmicola]|nr:ankyrin repeat-containing domain protein [Xylaria palmicola]
MDPSEDGVIEFLKQGPRSMNDVANLGATIEVLLQKGIDITQIGLNSIGTLALEVSIARENDIPFTLLLKHAPEQCLTQDTLDRMKVLFDENEPEIAHPLHEIFQEILDMECQSEAGDPVKIAVRFVQELLRSGTSWDTYIHYENQFLPAHINDDEFSKYALYAAVQNRSDDLPRLFEDCRFEKYTRREDEVANTFWSMAFMGAAESDSSDVFKVLFDYGFKPLHKYEEGDTAWHIAARSNSINILTALFDTCLNIPDALGVVSENGRTPLAEAMFYSQVKATELLLDRCGNDPAHFRSQPPVLHLSARMGSQPIFQRLIAKNLPGMDKALDGSTPLYFLSDQCNADFLRALTALYDPDGQRQDGKVAIQTYMTSVLDSGLSERISAAQLTSMIKMLAPTNCKVQQSNSDIHVWTDFCQQLGLAGNLECSLRTSTSFLRLVTAFREAHITDS